MTNYSYIHDKTLDRGYKTSKLVQRPKLRNYTDYRVAGGMNVWMFLWQLVIRLCRVYVENIPMERLCQWMVGKTGPLVLPWRTKWRLWEGEGASKRLKSPVRSMCYSFGESCVTPRIPGVIKCTCRSPANPLQWVVRLLVSLSGAGNSSLWGSRRQETT